MQDTSGLGAFAYGLGIAGVMIALMIYVTDKIKTTLGSSSADVNTTFENAIGAGKDVTGWFSIIVVVAMSAIAIGYFIATRQNV